MIDGSKLTQNSIPDEYLQNVCGGISDEQYDIVKAQLDVYMTEDDFDAFIKYTCQSCALYGDDTLKRVLDDYTANGYLSTSRANKLALLFAKL